MSWLIDLATSLPWPAYLTLAVVVLGLVAMLAVTAVVTNDPHRRDAALDALCVLLRRPYRPGRHELAMRTNRRSGTEQRQRTITPARRRRRRRASGPGGQS
jgi:hypothetical protein